MNTIDWDKIKTSLNDNVKLEDKMFIIPMSHIDVLYSLLKSEAMKDTIPIEWMKQWAMKNWVKSKNCEYDIIVSKMIEQWEKENE